jgi:hypothetical protein
LIRLSHFCIFVTDKADGRRTVADVRAMFMKILRAELEDLLEDVGIAERRVAERFAQREVTEYVFKQNDALFQGESESLHLLLERLGSFDHTRYPDLDELVKAVDSLVRGMLRDHERPEAVYRFFSRKVQKVRLYVESSRDPSRLETDVS